MQIHAKSHVTVTLVELKTGDEYVFNRHADEYDYQGNVPAGTYQFVIKNQTAVDQDVDIVHVPHYRMAPYPMDDRGNGPLGHVIDLLVPVTLSLRQLNRIRKP